MTTWIGKLLIASFLLTGFVTIPAWSQNQNARPARVGGINYVEGQASIDTGTLTPDSVGSVALEKDQTLATQAGKVEILLTPGVFLRVADCRRAEGKFGRRARGFPRASLTANTEGRSAEATSATILVYHRFGPVVADTMTVRTPVLASQLKFLHDNGYTVVPLRDVVNFLIGNGQLPPRAVAITADDGHRTVYTEMKPLVERYDIPVTLFIYPSAISNAPYAMTWEQLEDLQATGLFEIESHTYWHPNSRVEKRRLSATDYQKLVELQLHKSREVLESRFGTKVDLLAWPFGIYDDELIAAAQKAGYVAAFTIEKRRVSTQDNIMAIPRFIVTDSDVGKVFEELLNQEPVARGVAGKEHH